MKKQQAVIKGKLTVTGYRELNVICERYLSASRHKHSDAVR